MFRSTLRNQIFGCAGLTVFLLGAAAASARPAEPANSTEQLDGDNAQDVARVLGPAREAFARFRTLLITRSLSRMRQDEPAGAYGAFELWRKFALDATALDHVGHYDKKTQGIAYDQFGPPRTSRVLAIFHIALFEVANLFAAPAQHAASWLAGQPKAARLELPPDGRDEAAAIVGAAYKTLSQLYPTQLAAIAELKAQSIARIKAMHPPGNAALIDRSEAFGEAVASEVLEQRQNDHVKIRDARWTPSTAPESVLFTPKRPPVNGVFPVPQWQKDPVAQTDFVLGADWGTMPSFSGLKTDEFQLQDPPEATMSNPIYRKAFEQVLTEGGDEAHHIRRRDTLGKDRYFRAKFWAYDATAGLCAPVRLYDQIAATVLDRYSSVLAPDILAGTPAHLGQAGDAAATAEAARYFALVNMTMADAAIVAWHEKYRFQYWRPVTGIRWELEHKTGESPVHLIAEDPRPAPRLEHNTLWYPLGGQSTNTASGYNYTPPFPSYPSGHAVFGGALFEVLHRLVPNDTGFAFQSDEFNGAGAIGPNFDAFNFERCKTGDNSPVYCKPVAFANFRQAEIDNALSRVWMGVHWQFDASCGVDIGEKIGDWIVDRSFLPDSPGERPAGKRSTVDVANCASETLSDAYLGPLVP